MSNTRPASHSNRPMSGCSGEQYWYNGTCVDTCPNKFYSVVNGTKTCVQECGEHEIRHADADGRHTRCAARCGDIVGYNYLSGNACKSVCESGIYDVDVDKRCVDQCSSNMLKYDADSGMFACSKTACDGITTHVGSATYCTAECWQVGDGYYAENGRCVRKCSSGIVDYTNGHGACVPECQKPNQRPDPGADNTVCYTTCGDLGMYDDSGECVDACTSGLLEGNACVNGCEYVQAAGDHFMCIPEQECSNRLPSPDNERTICYNTCTFPNRVYMQNGTCTAQCGHDHYISVDHGTQVAYCVDSCAAINGQYVKYETAVCTEVCDLAENYVIEENGERFCITMEQLSEGITVTPLAAVVAAACGIIAIVTIVIVAVGDQKRKKLAQRDSIKGPINDAVEPDLLNK